MRVISLLLLMTWTLPAQVGRSYARSMVITPNGIVATSHTAASQAGAQILAKGGSAIDAALAASAVLTVTEPMMNGIGGDLFLLYWDAKTGKLTGLNASGWAPKRLSREFLIGKGETTMPRNGIQTVTVPGCVDGWSKAHKRFGRLPWKSLFDGAIYYAEHGYAVPEMLAGAWPTAVELDKFTAESRRVFLPGGKAPAEGDLFRNPEYTRALRLLADKGPDAFYRGEIARAILTTSEKLGGTMAAEDLAEYSAEWVEPISTEYRGWRIYELPPNGQGMAALQILNMMETLTPATAGPRSVEELHKRIEATKLAYADLTAYVADPRTSKVPVTGLLSKDYARKRAELISPARANCDLKAGVPASDTVYLTAIDREGNIASWIQSISALWGSGVTVEGMGFMLHNRGAGFVLDEGHPNVLAPRKRPFHTIIPAFMEKGDLHIAFGIMGGPNQPLAHAQFVSNFVDYGMNLQAAMEEPRFTKRSFGGCEVSVESRIPSETIEKLRGLGHQVLVYDDYALYMGRGQAVMRNTAKKMNYAGSDPRADGSAEAEPPR